MKSCPQINILFRGFGAGYFSEAHILVLKAACTPRSSHYRIPVVVHFRMRNRPLTTLFQQCYVSARVSYEHVAYTHNSHITTYSSYCCKSHQHSAHLVLLYSLNRGKLFRRSYGLSYCPAQPRGLLADPTAGRWLLSPLSSHDKLTSPFVALLTPYDPTQFMGTPYDPATG